MLAQVCAHLLHHVEAPAEPGPVLSAVPCMPGPWQAQPICDSRRASLSLSDICAHEGTATFLSAGAGAAPRPWLYLEVRQLL